MKKRLAVLFCFFAITASFGNTKSVDGFTTGWQSYDPPAVWSQQPISAYVDDSGGFYVVAGSDREIRGYLKLEQLQPLLQDVRTAKSLAVARFREAKLINTYANDAEIAGEKTGVRLTFRPDKSGGVLELLVKDFRKKSSRTTIVLLPAQMEEFVVLLERVPGTISALTKQDDLDALSNWLSWTLGIPLALAIVGLASERLRHRRVVREKDEALAEAVDGLAESGVRIQDLEAKNRELDKGLRKAGENAAQVQRDHADRIEQLRAAFEAENTKTISERELVKAFIELVTIRQTERDTPSVTSGIHDLSQTQERALADIMAHDRNRFILIEFKRERSLFARELTEKADVRGPQVTKICSIPAMFSTSVKCHFGGWNVRDHATAIEFAPYLDAWRAFGSHQPLNDAVPLDKFIDGFLPDLESQALYGAPASQFREYVKLLEQNAPASASNSATVPLLLVVRTGEKLPTFIRVPSMMVLLQMIQTVEQKIEQQKRIGQDVSTKIPRLSKGLGSGISR